MSALARPFLCGQQLEAPKECGKQVKMVFDVCWVLPARRKKNHAKPGVCALASFEDLVVGCQVVKTMSNIG